MQSNKLRKEDIEHKLIEMMDYVKQVHKYLPKKEDFLTDIIKKNAIYKIIESAIQEVIKICSMINSDLRLGIPQTEENIIEHLRNEKIISVKLAEKLIKMKNFRNVLVHRYGDIDDGEAYDSIKKNLNDFEKFKDEIVKFLKKA